MRIKTKVEVKEENIVIAKNTEGVVKAVCIYENKGYFYLVSFSSAKFPILVRQDDASVIDSSFNNSSISETSTSKQIDKAEEEFQEIKKAQRKLKRESKAKSS